MPLKICSYFTLQHFCLMNKEFRKPFVKFHYVLIESFHVQVFDLVPHIFDKTCFFSSLGTEIQRNQLIIKPFTKSRWWKNKNFNTLDSFEIFCRPFLVIKYIRFLLMIMTKKKCFNQKIEKYSSLCVFITRNSQP